MDLNGDGKVSCDVCRGLGSKTESHGGSDMTSSGTVFNGTLAAKNET